MSDQNSTAADQSPAPKMPPGIPYIVGNEAAERFSFYGMKTILYIYMTTLLVNATGQIDPMSAPEATRCVHLFIAMAYFFPLPGGILSDSLLGKYRTIFWLSLVYCLGHLALAVVPGRPGLWCGLILIGIGAGGIKPCVSANVGDQFTEENKSLLPRVFSWFYFSINFGAFFSTVLTPFLLAKFGPHVAFGVPGVLMGLATFVFWLGRNKFVHVKPAGFGFVREMFAPEGMRAIARLTPLYLFLVVFWCLYDQTASVWVGQAESMDRKWMGINWLSSQIQAINPVLVMVLIPICNYLIYPAINTVITLTPLRKVAIGFFLTVLAFSISARIEQQITGGKIIRNAPADSKGDVQELIIRLREYREWKIKNASWQIPELPKRLKDRMDKTGNPKFPLKMRVEVGDSPKAVWIDKGVQDFDLVLTEPHLIEFEESPAKYLRLTFSGLSMDSEADEDDFKSIWKATQVVRTDAVESTPPNDAAPQAAAAWPDVAAVGYRPNIGWQLLAYVVLTLAELMVSVTCLEFSYTQAPNKMKSLIMSLYLLSIAIGNYLTVGVNAVIENSNGTSKLPGASYYWFFTTLMLIAAIGFLVVVATYREKTYLQSAQDAE